MHFGLLVLALLMPAVAFAGDLPTTLPVVVEAEQVLRDVKQTSYEHKIQIDAAAGFFQTDCSGFVEFVLQRGAATSLAAVEKPHGHHRPLAEDFYQTFMDAPTAPGSAWQRIPSVADVSPGDILAWKSLTHEDGDHSDTGHVMIIDSVPQLVSPGVYKLVVIDSTKSPHAADTRSAGQTGVGRGSIDLVVDTAGHPTAYHWKDPAAKAHENPIAIGRARG